MALILVAEDAPELAEMLKHILESRGHQVAVASDGVEMIEKAKSLRPKLIISDIMMPGAYGSAAFKTLQDDPYTKGTPVIFLTAVSPEQAAKVVPADPGILILHKPVDVMALLGAVNKMLTPA
ncbi:MAG: putative response regulator/sensor histidine kinase [Elusimicrobia bacterium]|nr:MAG: putative response regulator/sensor histidine kinase [Elusimicrobiota bacterium]